MSVSGSAIWRPRTYPGALRALTPAATEGRLQLDEATYFLSTIELERGAAPTMATWRKWLFIATSSIAADDTEHFALPHDRTIVMSSRVEV
jgi:KUP system potassium uptake protein